MRGRRYDSLTQSRDSCRSKTRTVDNISRVLAPSANTNIVTSQPRLPNQDIPTTTTITTRRNSALHNPFFRSAIRRFCAPRSSVSPATLGTTYRTGVHTTLSFAPTCLDHFLAITTPLSPSHADPSPVNPLRISRSLRTKSRRHKHLLARTHQQGHSVAPSQPGTRARNSALPFSVQYLR